MFVRETHRTEDFRQQGILHRKAETGDVGRDFGRTDTYLSIF